MALLELPSMYNPRIDSPRIDSDHVNIDVGLALAIDHVLSFSLSVAPVRAHIPPLHTDTPSIIISGKLHILLDFTVPVLYGIIVRSSHPTQVIPSYLADD